jgi:hypothetical protein
VLETSWGGLGDAPGRFDEPLGIDVDAQRVYVADARNNRVQIFDRRGQLPALRLELREPGRGSSTVPSTSPPAPTDPSS